LGILFLQNWVLPALSFADHDGPFLDSLLADLCAQAENRPGFGGRLFGGLAALTLFVAQVGCSLTVFRFSSGASDHIRRFRGYHCGGPHHSTVCSRSATPVIRKIVLKALLWTAGLVIPLMGLTLFYVFIHVAQQSVNDKASIWNPFHYMGEAGFLYASPSS
jgi:hypothetical protein